MLRKEKILQGPRRGDFIRLSLWSDCSWIFFVFQGIWPRHSIANRLLCSEKIAQFNSNQACFSQLSERACVLRKEYGFTNKLVIDVCENIDIRNSDKKDVWELQQHSADLTSHTGGGCWHIILVTHFSTSGGNYGKWHGRPIENSALSWKLTHAHQKMEKQDRGECSSPVRIIAWQRIFLGKKQLWQNEKLSFFLTKKTSCHGTITPGVERLSCVHWEMKVTGLSVITKSH